MSTDSKLVVVAIGGNSLITDPEHMSVLDQYQAAGETAKHIAEIVERGYRVVITHGNGPQVGFILLRSELAREQLHIVPLESCVADTQGAIGYQIAQTLGNELARRNLDRRVVAVVTQTVVDPNDPAFANPSKPIGPFYSREEALAHQERDGWAVAEDAGRGWRRVVASPRPLQIIEEFAIRTLVDTGAVVVAVGGGGIPVGGGSASGTLNGQPAVVDKDSASSLLGKNLGAHIFMISTAVEKVMLNYGQPEQEPVDRMTVAEAKKYLAEGHFGEGSMKPKVEAAIEFLEGGGEEVIITQPHLLAAALDREAGTCVVP